MSKMISSPSKRWSGTVTLYDPLTLPQAEAVNESLDTPALEDKKPGRWLIAFAKQQIPVIIQCVEKWDLQNFPETVELNTFPMSPRKESHGLILWLMKEIIAIYNGEKEVPNE